jgi:LmbE family N-acetylglucosaminyl deacetylase
MSNPSLLCVSAHPDDLEILCSGAVHKLIKQDYRASLIVITNGENGFKAGQQPPAERIAIRKAEQMEAAKLLGLDEVIFLDYRDGFLEYSEELRKQLVEVIRRLKPNLVFSFDPANRSFESLNLLHRDHRVAAEAVFDACFAAKNLWMYPGAAHRVEAIWFYGTNQPNHFEDITAEMDFKLKLIACHRSQFPELGKMEQHLREDVNGQHGGNTYREAFRVLSVKQIT